MTSPNEPLSWENSEELAHLKELILEDSNNHNKEITLKPSKLYHEIEGLKSYFPTKDKFATAFRKISTDLLYPDQPDWSISPGKQIVIDWIGDGTLSLKLTSKEKHALYKNSSLRQLHPWPKVQEKMNGMLKVNEKMVRVAKVEEKAVSIEIEHVAEKPPTLRWDKSKAQEVLISMFESDGKPEMNPQQLYDSDACFREFPIAKFRKNFHNEWNRWVRLKLLKEEKKPPKKKKKSKK